MLLDPLFREAQGSRLSLTNISHDVTEKQKLKKNIDTWNRYQASAKLSEEEDKNKLKQINEGTCLTDQQPRGGS